MKLRIHVLILLSLISLTLVGCTVTPKQINPAIISFDGGQQNSGVIGTNLNGTIAVTPFFRERYNAVVETYGSRFKPPVTKDAGVTVRPDGGVEIDRQHFVYFLTMNRWRKEGK